MFVNKSTIRRSIAATLPLLCAPLCASIARPALAGQPDYLPAAPQGGTYSADETATAVLQTPPPLPQNSPAETATFLVDAALRLATSNPAARPVAVKTAAALLPRLSESGEGTLNREALTQRWAQLAMSSNISRAARLDAFDSFFDVGARTAPDFAKSWALKLPDAAARAGGLIKVSRAVESRSWMEADDDLAQAARAARQEGDLTSRARALTFVAYRATELNPARTESAVREASSQVNMIQTSAVKDNLLADLSGAAARYDLNMARTIAGRINDEGIKNLAAARVNIAEISQTTLTTRSKERVQALATAAAPYDARALPVLLQLPAQPEVLRAISETLPRIYPTARPAIETSLLERIWDYSQKAPEGVYRDQLQSRAARLMVLKDLWRGRSWGKQLTWRGGRVQVGAFLKDVLDARRSNLKADTLQEVAQKSVEAAYAQTYKLGTSARVEALLLLAGQVLD